MKMLLRIYRKIGRDRVVALAAGVTFYSLLAIFPAIAALVALYGIFADPATIASHLDGLSGVLPTGALEVLRDELNRLASQRGGTLGLTFLVGLGTSLWSANAGIKALFDALNLVYEEEEKRGLIRLNAISLAFTTGAIFLLLVALVAIVVLPVAMNFVGLPDVTETVVKAVRWPALFLVVALALAAIYRYGPSHTEARWRWITWGSAFAALAWLAASALFSWYAENFGSYNKTYGAARRRDRLHDLAVALDDHHPAGRGARRRDGAPDRARHDGRRRQAARRARRHHGGYGRAGDGLAHVPAKWTPVRRKGHAPTGDYP